MSKKLFILIVTIVIEVIILILVLILEHFGIITTLEKEIFMDKYTYFMLFINCSVLSTYIIVGKDD